MNTTGRAILAASTILALQFALLPGSAQAAVKLDERIDINLNEADLAGFFKALGQLTGARIVLDPGLDVKKKISIRLENVTVHTVLSAACDGLGCAWGVQDDAIQIRPRPSGPVRDRPVKDGAVLLKDPIDIHLNDANAGEVFRTFAQILGVELSLDEPLASGTLTLDIVDRSASDALDAACASLGCAWKLVPGSPRSVLQVKAAPPAPRD
ncbi:MAG TPA: hypothetical protein VHR45_13590 [Thermoanaerobaculia bacterium]|nr:hypothetical protein [Thermoanaerobaculia bacterium]